METRLFLLSALAGLVLQSGLAPRAFAQDRFVRGGELPMMALKACVSLQAAMRQATLSRDLGLLSFENAKADPRKEADCRTLRVRARPYLLEPVAPYMAWQATYDRSGPLSIVETFEGRSYSVPYSYQRQLTKIYKAVVTDKDGARFEGWVEIAERPYMMEFVQELTRSRREK